MQKLSRRQLMQIVGSAGTLAALDTAHGATLSGRNEKSQHRSPASWDPAKIGAPMMRDPVWVYDTWSAHTDGLYPPDDTRLTEELVMRELHAVLRLKRLGVRFDGYMINAFWFAPDGAYRQFRQPDWPKGPDRWIAACHENGVKPGLWFGTNALLKLDAAPQWRDSLELKDRDRVFDLDFMSLHEGGFLPDFMQTLHYWYDRGIRLFEFDFANFDAATPQARQRLSPEQIRVRNQQAFSDALQAFRRQHPDALLAGFNGFSKELGFLQQQDYYATTESPRAPTNPTDLRWLEVFDSLYCGDIRVSDVPQVNFWRSVDVYCDHMVRRYEQNFVPLERLDTFCILSTTKFGYARKTSAWKGMLLLTAARGSWKQTIYGNLELLSDEDARWFAKVQSLYAPLLALGRTKSFGGFPGDIEPYGFGSCDQGGVLYTVVNPTQEVRTIELPLLSRVQAPLRGGRILFRDAGFSPRLQDAQITLGPGQMAVAGFGRYARPQHDLGVQHDVVIPRTIQPIDATFHSVGNNVIEATIPAPSTGDLRILFRQRSQDGVLVKSSNTAAGSPSITELLKIEARQRGKTLLIARDQEETAHIFGISWGAGEIRNGSFAAAEPMTISCSSAEEKTVVLEARLYTVAY